MGDDNAPLSAKFLSVSSGVPLADRDVIAIGPNFHLSPLHVENIDAKIATNMRYILETGQSYGYTGSQMPRNARVDWNADDAYTTAVDGAVERVSQRIASDIEIQALLSKPEWSRDDRMAWERKLSGFVSEEVDVIPGLGDYRSNMARRYRSGAVIDDPSQPYQSRLPGNIEREPMEKAYRSTYSLNELSRDIENGTIENEYDCDIMSITEGAVLQRVEDVTLPREPEAADSLKYAASYFAGVGWATSLDFGFLGSNTGYHAYLVSSATGAAIESTADPSTPGSSGSYVVPQEGYSFEKYVQGMPLVDPDNVIYSPTLFSANFFATWYGSGLVALVQDGISAKMEKLSEFAAQHREAPEMEAMRNLIALKAQTGGLLDSNRAGEWNELIEKSAMSSEFLAMQDMVGDISGYTDILLSLAIGDFNGDAVPDMAEQGRRQIRDFLQEQRDIIVRDIPNIPAGTIWFDNGNPLLAKTAQEEILGSLDLAIQAISADLPPEPKLPTFYNQQVSSPPKIEF